MNEDLHQIDDLFRSGLDGKEESPTPIVWENIERELDKKERKPVAGFFQNSGKAAAILLVFLGSAALFATGYFLRDINHTRDNGSQVPNIRQTTPHNGSEKSDSLTGTIDMPVSVSEGNTVDETPAPVESKNASEKSFESKHLQKTELSKDRDNLQPDEIASISRSGDKNKASKTNSATKPVKTTRDAALIASGAGSANKKTGSAPKNKTTSQSLSPSTGKTTSIIDPEPIASSTYSQMAHEPASVTDPISSHEVPTAEKTLDLSHINAVRKHETPKSVTQANIPVANKKSGSLNLPRLSITPVVTMQTVSNKVTSDGSRWGEQMKEGIDESEHLPNRLAGGILFDVKISRSLTLQSGLVLSQKDVHIDPKTVWAVKDIDGKVRYRLDCSAGTYYINPKQGSYPRPGDMAVTNYSSNSLNYLNIPLSLKWHFGSKKLQLFTNAGIGLNLLTSQSLEATLMHQYSYSGGRVSNLKSSFVNGMIGAGLNYNFTDKIGLNISPQYQFAITPMNENMPVSALPRTFSLQLGLQLKLK